MKTKVYIRCFIDMSLYNNFNEETKADVLRKKIEFMFENKNTVNRVSIFRKIVRLTPGCWCSLEMKNKTR